MQSLQPNASGPTEGLQEVQRRLKESGLQQTRERALLLASEERWAEALVAYESMLAKDPNLTIARTNSVQAKERAELDQRLEELLTQPVNWWNPQGRNLAQSVLSEARSVDQTGPKLQSQINALSEQIELANRQVPVTLVSDQLCQVVVYKVGRLGQFQSTELKLYPGRYTVVGTRNGYRDVRREFLVSPEPRTEPVVLHCNEKVADTL